MQNLETNYALITGANGGIGQSLCEVFSENGYSVIATDIHLEPAIGLKCSNYVDVDLSKLVENEKYADIFFGQIEKIIDRQGLSAMVNNAAIQVLGGVDSLHRDDWRMTLNINLVAPFLLAQRFVNKLEKSGGSIVNISSIHAKLTKRNFVAYATSKAAISGMSKAMAVDLGARVRVNAIEPAATATEMLKAGFLQDPKKFTTLEEYHPTQCICRPEEIALLALFLSGKSNNFLHGCCVDISGGISAVLHDPDV